MMQCQNLLRALAVIQPGNPSRSELKASFDAQLTLKDRAELTVRHISGATRAQLRHIL